MGIPTDFYPRKFLENFKLYYILLKKKNTEICSRNLYVHEFLEIFWTTLAEDKVVGREMPMIGG